jgi:hypothetical protein
LTRAESITKINRLLATHLEELHLLLKKYPDPPTFAAMVTFGGHHNADIKALREGFFRYQLAFATVLGESLLLDEDSIDALPAVLRPKNEIREPFHQNGNVQKVANDIHGDQGDIVKLLLELPPTLRLSHLVETLELLQNASAFPDFSALNEGMGSVFHFAKELDQRLLRENHFSNEVKTEL